MITPNEIRKKAENKFEAYLQSIISGEKFFPIVIAGNKKPNDNTVLFEKELTDLMAYSKEQKGFGYSLKYQTVKTNNHGVQDIPVSISFESEQDYLKFIGKVQATVNFRVDLEKILPVFPELKEWVGKYPNKVITNHDIWDDLLKVCVYFNANPSPFLYIRELPIKVHTKFIEQNKTIIRELLDIIIAEHINQDEKHFERRFNLKYDEPLVRFRLLDKSIQQQYFFNMEDISLPIEQFRKLNIPVSTVYIVENKMNMLTFPHIENSIVIWGHGFGVDIMKDVEWMNDKRIFYWGDIDSHGFQILSEVRTHFPMIKSFLMDRETFDTFFEEDKGSDTNVEKELCLSQEESDMFQYLKVNNYRLEQEKIPYEYAKSRIPK
jgi:hypothetical protein